MKFVIALSLMFAMLSSCNSAKDVNSKKEGIKLTDLKTSYDVKVGDKMNYSVGIHGSVGNQASVSVSDAKVVKELSVDFEYKDKSKSKMSGGDGGVRTYTYEALSSGVTTITIVKEFRGEVTDTYELTINVTN